MHARTHTHTHTHSAEQTYNDKTQTHSCDQAVAEVGMGSPGRHGGNLTTHIPQTCTA